MRDGRMCEFERLVRFLPARPLFGRKYYTAIEIYTLFRILSVNFL